MPDDNTVWPVWLALPESPEAVEVARSIAEVERIKNGEDAVSVPVRRDADWSCAGALAFVIFAVTAIYLSIGAVFEGHSDAVLLLLAAHLPIVALIVRLRQELRSSQETQNHDTLDRIVYPRPPSVLRAYKLTRCRETGVELHENRFLGWDECSSCAFAGSEGHFFTILLTRRIPYPIAPAPLRPRLILLLKGILVALSLLIPFCLSLVALGYGWTHFGLRTDVRAAFFAVLAHLVLLTAFFSSLVGKRQRHPDEEHPKAQEIRLVFDSRVVSATEVLNRMTKQIRSDN